MLSAALLLSSVLQSSTLLSESVTSLVLLLAPNLSKTSLRNVGVSFRSCTAKSSDSSLSSSLHDFLHPDKLSSDIVKQHQGHATRTRLQAIVMEVMNFVISKYTLLLTIYIHTCLRSIGLFTLFVSFPVLTAAYRAVSSMVIKKITHCLYIFKDNKYVKSPPSLIHGTFVCNTNRKILGCIPSECVGLSGSSLTLLYSLLKSISRSSMQFRYIYNALCRRKEILSA